jgi:Amt family ammonium transporter
MKLTEIASFSLNQASKHRMESVEIPSAGLEAEPLVNEILNAISEGVILIDANGLVKAANLAALTILGVKEPSLIGQTVGAVVRTSPSCDLSPEKIAQSGYTDREVDLETEDGTRAPVGISARRICRNGTQQFVVLIRDLRSSREVEAYLKNLASYDPLTGLGNRRLLDERLSAAIAACENSRSSFALLYLDLDHFKSVNDHFGHHVGDKLLQEVAGILQDAVRETDTVIRLGGDEFAIIVQNLSGSCSPEVLACRLTAQFARPFHINNAMVKIGVSIGISFYPENALDSDALMRAADTALYDAKSSGRGCHKIYCEKIRKKRDEGGQIETDMKLGLVRNEFEVFYQPIIGMNGTAEILGFEALVRWRHPVKGILLPAEFIPAAELNGLISHIDKHVFSTACKQLSSWSQVGVAPLKMSVNIADQQLEDLDFTRFVINTVRGSNINPKFIELEISEKALLLNSDLAANTIKCLREFGVRIGTGLSSLSRIQEMPIDTIKLDQSFVQSLRQKPESSAILKTMLDLGEELGLMTVVEGVENDSELELVRRFGCNAVQGFVYSKPRSSSSAGSWIDTYSAKLSSRERLQIS